MRTTLPPPTPPSSHAALPPPNPPSTHDSLYPLPFHAQARAGSFEGEAAAAGGLDERAAEAALAGILSHRAVERPSWDASRGNTAKGRAAVAKRREGEGRPPAVWAPTDEALRDGWGRLGAAEDAYEAALRGRLEAIVEERRAAEEAERLRKEVRY